MRTLLLCLATLPVWAQGLEMSRTEAEVLRLLNEARANPAAFSERYIRGGIASSPEGRECVREMRRTPALPRLRPAQVLMRSARDHARDLQRTGRMSHNGSDGSNLRDRVERHGRWTGSLAENLFFGDSSPQEIVVELLVDRGVPGRGHRRNILDGNLNFAGVSVRPHPSFGWVCVIDFATRVGSLDAN